MLVTDKLRIAQLHPMRTEMEDGDGRYSASSPWRSVESGDGGWIADPRDLCIKVLLVS